MNDVTADHPLLAAFADMGRAATMQKGLRALARIKLGTENRIRWIENRQAQIDALTKLQTEVLAAYDDGDAKRMASVYREIERIVSTTEGVSAEELQVGEIFEGDDDIVAEVAENARHTFPSKRKTSY